MGHQSGPLNWGVNCQTDFDAGWGMWLHQVSGTDGTRLWGAYAPESGSGANLLVKDGQISLFKQ